MKRISYLILTICTSLAIVGCVDDDIKDTNATTSPFDESDIINTKLAVSVNDFLVSVSGTRTDDKDHEDPTDETETMSDFEKTVDNIWVFQYDANGNLLIKPRYYTAAESQNYDGSWDVVLKPVESTIYVVTNVNRDTWASDYTNFMTINDGLLKQSLPFPEPITDTSDEATTGHIPMQGRVGNVFPGGLDNIVVSVEHMYAKVKMRVLLDNDLDVYYAYINSVSFSNIPWYCRVGTLYEGTAASKDDKYPTTTTTQEGTTWITRSFTEPNNTDDSYNDQFEEGFTYDYVIYVPENIQGEVVDKTSEDKDEKGTNAPEHACTMTVDIGYVDEGGVQESAIYTVYPGGNEWNNYNVRRNQVYRVTVEIGYPLYATNQPSANCIVGHPGTTISFEPYYRVETGGGYDFTTYLDPTDDNKKIKGYKILWQTLNCIGNNSKGNLVTFELNEEEPVHSKFYVTVNQPGNAVIAAYDSEDCTGNIIWSWHIWVTDEDPTNIGNAIVYYTYDWDANGIYGEGTGVARVPGYGCMPCNLGALASTHDGTVNGKVETYGLLYQWGRKDPFPALKSKAKEQVSGNFYSYSETTTENLYDNSHQRITGMTADEDEDKLFHSVSGATISVNSDAYGVDFTIKNPTIFLCGTDKVNTQDATYLGTTAGSGKAYYESAMKNYTFGGDWMPDHDERLWGALPIDDNTISCYVATEVATEEAIYMHDTYGSKSIYDPCPYGWRVSPPDQWLGFSYTGYNPTSYNNINTTETVQSGNDAHYGMELYIQAWKSGLTSYFPTEGARAADGCGLRPTRCGNYHNATTDPNDSFDRVNILHVHNSTAFRIFEYENICFYSKATACPVRCVRDTK